MTEEEKAIEIRARIDAIFGQWVPTQRLTLKDIAARYDSASGVPGWSAKPGQGGRIDLYPPPGYTVVWREDGAMALVEAFKQVRLEFGFSFSESKP